MDDALIHRDPKIMLGKPVVRGTRITVEHILREMSHGASLASLTSNYGVTVEQINAALRYAADALRRSALDDAGITEPVFDSVDGWTVTPL